MIVPVVPWVVVPLAWLAAVSIPLVVIDARTLRLPNALVVPGLVLSAWALVGAAVGGPAPDAVAGLAGAVTASMVLGAAWMVGAVGMGDVKLGVWLGTVAGMLGPAGQVDAVLQAVVVGGVVAGAQLVTTPHGVSLGAFGLSGGRHSADVRIPLGPPLLAVFWCAAARILLA